MYSIYLFILTNVVFDYSSFVSCSHDLSSALKNGWKVDSRTADTSFSSHNNSIVTISNGDESKRISETSSIAEHSVDKNNSFHDVTAEGSVEGRNIKKLSMAMLPLVFKVGAASTWMIVTMILAAKSVLLGLILLIFKIAVSAGKVSSFFTGQFIKAQHHQNYHQPTPWYHAPPTAHDHSYGKNMIRVVAHVQPHLSPFGEDSFIPTDSHYEGSSKYSTIGGDSSVSESRQEDIRNDDKEDIRFRVLMSGHEGDIYVTAPPTY